MATNTLANGNNNGATGTNDLTPAQRLQQQHEADAIHHVTVETIEDEEDIIHPPPSAAIKHAEPEAQPSPLLVPEGEPLSKIAMGKQKERDEPEVPTSAPKPSEAPTLDTKSEEAFPALGGPKPRNTAPSAMAWGSKKPETVSKAIPNGVNGHARSSSTASSQASTPASGVLTPPSTNASNVPPSRAGVPQFSLPGQHVERVHFAQSQLLPRSQLRKPLPDLLREVNKKSKAAVQMRPGPSGVIFEGKGPVDAVRQALRDIAKEIGSKQSVKIPIPLSVRPHVIGRQGAVIQSIQKNTGARVQVSKIEDIPAGDNEDDSMTVDVSIEGDALAAEMARRDIEAIVNEHTSTVNLRLRNIPPEYYPFLAGPRNSNIDALAKPRDLSIKVPQYYSWLNQPPQVPSPGSVPRFTPHPTEHIHIHGDRLRAMEARAAIERRVEFLRQQITLSDLSLDRGRHQFIVGEQGALLHDLLESTGCAVIVPPDSDSTETLFVVGPRDRINNGMEKVLELATSMQMSNVDIARYHPNAPAGSQAHAKALTQYLQQKKAIEELEKRHGAHIVLPTSEDSPMNWELYSRDGKSGVVARSEIINIVNAHPPARIRHVDMDPFFHQHVYKEAAQSVLNEHGVHMLHPNTLMDSPYMIMIYEGRPGQRPEPYVVPTQRPSAEEVTHFENALHMAQQHILGLIEGQQDLAAKDIAVPGRFHGKVQKFVSRQQEDNASSQVPVQIKSNPIHGGSSNGMILRGPNMSVDDLFEKILAFVETEKQDERERSYSTGFDFPQKYANYLIGRKGEAINKIREDFDVDVQVQDGKVEVKGPKAKAEAAKSHIISLGRKYDDQASHVLKIAPQYHRDIIGAKGSQVNRLQERYDVRVQFPRAKGANNEHSLADSISDAGNSRSTKNQAPDEVIVRGPKKGADQARDELLNLLQWIIDNSHTSTVSVARSQLPSLIGQGGREMESLRLTTGAQIDVPGSRDASDSTGRVDIKIKGTKKQVQDAKELLEQRAKVFDDSITRSIYVDKKHIRNLIGAGGANIRNIIVEAGGSQDPRERTRTVRLPRADSSDSTVIVEGNKALVEKIVASIQAFINEREDQTTELVEIAPEKHRLLIGRGGETRRALESELGVSIDIPRQSEQEAARSHIKLVGNPTKVVHAKQHILNLVKDHQGETVSIPRGMHHVISDNGQLFRRLHNEHKVSCDHGGHPVPSKANTTRLKPHAHGGASLPLITDDPDSAGNFSWKVIDHDVGNGEEGEIPWILRGKPENIAKARAILQKALEQAQQQSSTGYLILPDPRFYRQVVGQNGNQVNAITKETGCQVKVPRPQAHDEAIEISGSKDGVELAKDIILEIVRTGGD